MTSRFSMANDHPFSEQSSRIYSCHETQPSEHPLCPTLFQPVHRLYDRCGVEFCLIDSVAGCGPAFNTCYSYSRPAGRTDLTPEKLKRRIDLLVLPLSVPPLCLPSRPTSNRLFLSLEVKRMAEMTQRSCSSCTSLWQCSRSLRSRRPRSNRNSGACRLVGSESSVASNTSVAILSPSGRPATRPSGT